MIPVLWTIDLLDWCSNVGCITERVVNKARENEIILMHDYYDTSVTAALKVVDELLEEGYIIQSHLANFTRKPCWMIPRHCAMLKTPVIESSARLIIKRLEKRI